MSDYLSDRELEKIRSKQSELASLSNSESARKIRQNVDADALRKALQAGDSQSVSNAVSQILSTKEGSEFFKNLENLLK